MKVRSPDISALSPLFHPPGGSSPCTFSATAASGEARYTKQCLGGVGLSGTSADGGRKVGVILDFRWQRAHQVRSLLVHGLR